MTYLPARGTGCRGHLAFTCASPSLGQTETIRTDGGYSAEKILLIPDYGMLNLIDKSCNLYPVNDNRAKVTSVSGSDHVGRGKLQCTRTKTDTWILISRTSVSSMGRGRWCAAVIRGGGTNHIGEASRASVLSKGTPIPWSRKAQKIPKNRRIVSLSPQDRIGAELQSFGYYL